MFKQTPNKGDRRELAQTETGFWANPKLTLLQPARRLPHQGQERVVHVHRWIQQCWQVKLATRLQVGKDEDRLFKIAMIL